MNRPGYENSPLNCTRRRVRVVRCPPDEPFIKVLRDVFATADAQVVSFHNPFLKRDSSSTVYVAQV